MFDHAGVAAVMPHAHAGLRDRTVLVDYGLLLGWFVASRLAVRAWGLPFETDLRWMFLADPAELRDHLFRTVVYFHAFPPGMNLLTGILLKIDPTHLTEWAAPIFSAFAFVLVASLHYLARACGLSRLGAGCLAAAFSVLPQTLFLENLYLYTVPSASLLCLSAVLFHRATRNPSRVAWLSFFGVCAALCWIRTTFHLIWFGAMLVLAWFATGRPARRNVALGAAAPAALLLALYLKNYLLFGVFGTTSWGGANLVSVTTRQLPDDERHALVQAGELSPFAEISAFSEPSQYVSLFRERPRPSFTYYPGADELFRPTVHAGNFNHWFFLVINEQRRQDALYYLKTHPREYADTVLRKSLPEFFSSTTHWHPRDDREDSPHHRHRQVLGRYEAFYDRCVHGFPITRIGVYVFLPFFIVWTALYGLRMLRSGDLHARAMLLAFALAQILFVTVVSILLSYSEASRYRYMIEAFIWLLVAIASGRGVSWLLRRIPDGIRRRARTAP